MAERTLRASAANRPGQTRSRDSHASQSIAILSWWRSNRRSPVSRATLARKSYWLRWASSALTTKLRRSVSAGRPFTRERSQLQSLQRPPAFACGARLAIRSLRATYSARRVATGPGGRPVSWRCATRSFAPTASELRELASSYRNSVHQALLAVIVVGGIMPGAAVVPERDRTRTPAEAAPKLRSHRVTIEIIK